MTRVPKVVLLIESSRSSGRDLLLGVADYARRHGPWALDWQPGGLEKAWPVLKSLDADGIILRDMERVDDVLRCGIPAIVVGHSKHEVHGVANVITHSRLIAEMAAEHLIDCGLRYFAYAGYKDLPWSSQRGETFSRAVARAGFESYVYSPPIRSSATWQTEQTYMAKWLQKLPKPIGLMACNDDRGENVIEACKIAGLRVPDEVAIIGADNDELVCELSDPPLSSVAINFERAGYESAQLLARLMRAGKGRAPANIIVRPTHVVPRQSTDTVFTDDPIVARALRYIRHHSRTPITVSDVVTAAGLSRRVVEKRFRKAVGRSVLNEIRRARVEEVSRMLLRTNQPISEIADTLGFAGIEHIARYFRQVKGATPRSYRKQYGQP